MNRIRPPLLASTAFLAIVLSGMLECIGQEAPPAPANAPKSQDSAAGNAPKAPATTAPVQEAPAPAAGGAGLVRVVLKNGKARIGMDRKELEELVKKTVLGRMNNIQAAIEEDYSLSCPGHVVELPNFLIGKYEVTNAQWAHFLETAAKRSYTIPERGKLGARTLDEISKMFLLREPFSFKGGLHYPVANSWRELYELNEATLNPVVAEQDPKTRPGPELFQKREVPPGTRILCYRWSVPTNWKVKGRLRAVPPEGWENLPVTLVSLADAQAFCRHYGLHVPTEDEWEAAARGPGGELWPEGEVELQGGVKGMDLLGHAWKDFTVELLKAKPKAAKDIVGARKRLEDAGGRGDARAVAAAQEDVDHLQWILNARELPDSSYLDAFPFVEVGLFPFGRSRAGAMDLVGNVDEWVSTPLRPYPGTDSKSFYRDARAYVVRGGNLFDKDSILTATFRKFRSKDVIIGKHFKANSAGFRVARYEVPGASAASCLIVPIVESSPAILPREENERTHEVYGPGLDIYRASGIERYDEAAWDAGDSPRNDPAGKVFWLGKAEGLCMIPPTGTPFREPAALRKAALDNPIPKEDADGRIVEKRQPRDLPFLGVLYVSEALEFKGELLLIEEKEVPLTPEEMKVQRERWEREQKEKKEKEKKEGEGDAKDGGGDKKDGGGDDKKDGDGNKKMEDGKGSGEGGKKGDKGGDKGGAKGGDKPADPASPDAPADDAGEVEEEEKDKEPDFPKTKKIKVPVHRQGFLKGSDRPGRTADSRTVAEEGLLFGLLKIGEEVRGVFWEARQGNVGSMALGGLVMLEPPLVVLPKDSVEFKKVGKAPAASSQFDTTKGTGEVTLKYFIPVEGKSDFIEVTLKLTLGDYPLPTPGRPWVTLTPK